MRLVEVRVNTTRKGEEKDIKAWELSDRSAHSLLLLTHERKMRRRTQCVVVAMW